MSDHLSGEVIGFRQWYVTPDLKLRAAHMRQQTWEPGANEAKCHRVDGLTVTVTTGMGASYGDPVEEKPCNSAPGSDCECGWYALHDPSDFWYGKQASTSGLYGMVFGTAETDPLVSGVIAAWGNVEVHHQGFRAQHARVVAIALPEGKRDAVVARAVATEYGVPVVAAKQLAQIAGEFGSTVPVEMRPEKPEPKEINGGFTAQFNNSQLYSQMVKYTLPSFSYGSLSAPISVSSGSLWTPNPTDASKSVLGAFDFKVEDAKAKTPKASGPSLPRKVPKYDPRAYLPKRKGGLA